VNWYRRISRPSSVPDGYKSDQMSPKNKLLSLVIAVTAIVVVFFQTGYRYFYQSFPWGAFEDHTTKYPASLGFINPNSQSFLMIVSGIVIIFIILAYYPKEITSPER
jgi:hypothetical protein